MIMRVVVGVIRETTVMLPNLDGLKLGAPTGVILNADDLVHAKLMFNLVKDVPIWGVEAFERLQSYATSIGLKFSADARSEAFERPEEIHGITAAQNTRSLKSGVFAPAANTIWDALYTILAEAEGPKRFPKEYVEEVEMQPPDATTDAGVWLVEFLKRCEAIRQKTVVNAKRYVHFVEYFIHADPESIVRSGNPNDTHEMMYIRDIPTDYNPPDLTPEEYVQGPSGGPPQTFIDLAKQPGFGYSDYHFMDIKIPLWINPDTDLVKVHSEFKVGYFASKYSRAVALDEDGTAYALMTNDKIRLYFRLIPYFRRVQPQNKHFFEHWWEIPKDIIDFFRRYSNPRLLETDTVFLQRLEGILSFDDDGAKSLVQYTFGFGIVNWVFEQIERRNEKEQRKDNLRKEDLESKQEAAKKKMDKFQKDLEWYNELAVRLSP